MKNDTLTSLPDTADLTNEAIRLLRRIQALVVFFIFAIFISGATAIPLTWEMEMLTRFFPKPLETDTGLLSDLARWLHWVKTGLVETDARYPFLAYGYDWLAFGHFMIALVFVGAYRDPIRNLWLFDFGMLACFFVIPFALIFGEVRGIPYGWRLIDCAFGIFGFPLIWLAKRETLKLMRAITESAATNRR